MRHFSYLSIALAAAFVVTSGTSKAHATHIDQLGFDVSLFSSNGMGGFSIKFTEYLGSDGSAWGGTNWASFWTSGAATAATAVKSFPFTATLTTGPGSLSPSGSSSAPLKFQGLVNSVAVPTAGFGTGQFFTQFVNGTSDAAEFSAVVAFTITGFDSSASYQIDVAGSDCCFVSGGGGPSFNEAINFDPSVVVNPNAVPEPSSLALLGIGTLCLIGYRRKRRRAIAAGRGSEQV